MWRFIIRLLIKPILDALKSELSWISNKYEIEEDLKKQIEKMSQSQLKLLMDDKLASEVYNLKTAYEKEQAKVSALMKVIKMMQEEDATLKVEMEKYRHEVRALYKLFRAAQQNETKQYFEKKIAPQESKTEVLNFE